MSHHYNALNKSQNTNILKTESQHQQHKSNIKIEIKK